MKNKKYFVSNFLLAESFNSSFYSFFNKENILFIRFFNKYVKLVIKEILFYRNIMNNVDINLTKNKNFSLFLR